MAYIIMIEPDELVGPFDTEIEAHNWAEIMIETETYSVQPLYFPRGYNAHKAIENLARDEKSIMSFRAGKQH